MKKIFSLFVTLTLLLLGVVNAAFAAEVTETYDFKTFTASSQPAISLSQTEVTQSGTNAKTVYVVNNPTGLDLKGRFALCSNASTNVTMRWMFRNGTNAWQYGLCGNWNGNGTAVDSYNISILNLKKDDKVTITYKIRSGKPAELHNCAADVISTAKDGTGLAAASVIASGTTYYMLKDGNLDIYDTNDNLGIEKIVIVTTVDNEIISDKPSISLTGVSGGNRTVSITSPKTTADNNTVTYYTLDGSTPTSESTAYTGAITLTPTDADGSGNVTIKAISYKDGDINIASGVTELTVTGIGTEVTLATPTLQKTALTAEGYTVALASDQSGILCKPTASIMYSIDDAAAVEYSAPITLALGSSIKAYAAATGYANSANVEYTAVTPEGYTASKTLDFTAYAEGKGTNDTGTTINVSGTNLEKFLVDEVAVDEDFYVQPVNNSYRFYIHVAGADHGLYCFYGGGRLIGLANQKKDDIIKIKASIEPTVSANLQALPDYSYGDNYYFKVVADGNCGLNITRYTFIRNIEVLTEVPAVVELTLTNTSYSAPDSQNNESFTGYDAEGNAVNITVKNGELNTTYTSMSLKEDHSLLTAVSGTATIETNEGVTTLDANVTFDNGTTYHITGTYEAPAQVHVATFNEFKDAMSENNNAVVILDEDIELSYSFQAKGKKILNANGHKITSVGGYIDFTGEATITGNGTFENAEDWTYQMLNISKGANLTIENGTFTAETGMLISASAGNNDYGTMKMTINDGVFIADNKLMHFQNPSTNVAINVEINGGVFVSKHEYLGPIDDAGINQNTHVTINKGAFAAMKASKVFYLYSSATNITIPAGKTYVIDGVKTEDIAEAKDAREFTGKVLYVGESSEFSAFHLQNSATTIIKSFGITIPDYVYGHQAHSAVFVNARPETGYAKFTFTTPADATIYDLGNDNYCVMPFTPDMYVAGKGEKVQVSEIAITTKTGCIPELGQNFWTRKANSTECKQMIDYESKAFYVDAMHWRTKGEGTIQESSAVFESGKDYELYLKFYLNSGYEFADEVTVTIDGKPARFDKTFKEIYFDYSIPNLPITITEYYDFSSIEEGSAWFIGNDADGNNIRVAFANGNIHTKQTGYVASDESWECAATAGTGSLSITAEQASFDAVVTFDNGITYHITGTYVIPVYPLGDPTVTVDYESVKIEWNDAVISENNGFSLAKGHIIMTVGEDVYDGSVNETDAVEGKLTITIPFNQVMHRTTWDTYTPKNGDVISIKIEDAELDAKATADDSWEEIWSGDIDGINVTFDATGISNVSSVAAKVAAIYNIAGQRMNAKAKGLVIKNGKKLVVK